MRPQFCNQNHVHGLLLRPVGLCLDAGVCLHSSLCRMMAWLISAAFLLKGEICYDPATLLPLTPHKTKTTFSLERTTCISKGCKVRVCTFLNFLWSFFWSNHIEYLLKEKFEAVSFFGSSWYIKKAWKGFFFICSLLKSLFCLLFILEIQVLFSLEKSMIIGKLVK